jgi:hypothetical protein
MAFVAVAWRVDGGGRRPLTALPHLADSWSFKDSVVSSVTVIGGLLAGIFGSADVVKAMLGEEAEASVALATVAGAISVALIGAAGVLVLALRTPEGKFTGVGVLLGSVLALGAAGAQLVIVYEATRKFDLGGFENNLTPFLWAGVLLLVLYGVLSVYSSLVQGDTEPSDPDPAASEAAYAAAVLAAAAPGKPRITREEVEELIEKLQTPKPPKEPSEGEGEGKAGRRRHVTSPSDWPDTSTGARRRAALP